MTTQIIYYHTLADATGSQIVRPNEKHEYFWSPHHDTWATLWYTRTFYGPIPCVDDAEFEEYLSEQFAAGNIVNLIAPDVDKLEFVHVDLEEIKINSLPPEPPSPEPPPEPEPVPEPLPEPPQDGVATRLFQEAQARQRLRNKWK